MPTVLERLREIERDDKAEAIATMPRTTLDGFEIPPYANSIEEAARVMDHRRMFSVMMPDTFRPRNDITPLGPQGSPWDGRDLTQALQVAMSNYSPIRRLATVVQVNNSLKTHIPGVNADTATEATIVAEGSAVPSVDPVFNAWRSQARKFGTPKLSYSISVKEDASEVWRAGSVKMIGNRMARGQNNFFTNGLAGEGAVNVAPVGVTCASQTTIAVDELWDLITAVPAPYTEAPTCAWMMHSKVRAIVRKLKDGVGHYVWRDAGFDQWPIVTNDHMASSLTANAKPILFGDFSQFVIVDYGPLRIQTLGEMKAEFYEEQMLSWAYCDGAIVDPGTHPIVSLKMSS